MNNRHVRTFSLLLIILITIPALVIGESVFRLRPPLWIDHDDRPIPQPETRQVSDLYAILYNTWFRHLSPEQIVAKKQPSLNVNAWDEVPDSTWFTNRIGRQPLSFDEIVNGIAGKPPQPPSWRVIRRNDSGYTPKVD